LFPIIYFVFKLVRGTRLKRLSEIDLVSGRRTDLDGKGVVPEDFAGDPLPKRDLPWWKRVFRSF